MIKEKKYFGSGFNTYIFKSYSYLAYGLKPLPKDFFFFLNTESLFLVCQKYIMWFGLEVNIYCTSNKNKLAATIESLKKTNFYLR